ncbi:MAG: TonB-dependent receptor [Sphingopyxis sp.]|nr:TonB-dependent receptor [Sphingopyxis sp.]
MAHRLRTYLCVTAALVASPALAQEQPDAPQDGDIVVTATRTESLASKTPIALTAIGSEGLRDAGVTNPTALADVVPNLSIDRANGLQITIRGVTSTDGTEKGDPSAAFLLDGVYIARPQAQEVSFFDIERVEVLRGPQGTLFGRNTTAGVVHVISARPTDRFSASFDATYGNYDTIQATAVVNVPVATGFALRGALNYDRRDSYVIQSATSPFGLDPAKKNLSARLSALIEFGPDISLLVKGDYSSIKGRPTNTVRLTNFFDRPFVAEGRPHYISMGSAQRRTRLHNDGVESFYDNETWGISAELNWAFGPVDMTYLGSYRELTRHEGGPQDFGGPIAFPGVFDGEYWQNSQELRFAYNDGGPFTGQVGGYYFKEKSGIGAYILNPPFIPGATAYGFPQDPTISESKGVFGQVSYELIPDLKLTGGIRYSHDLKSRVGQTVIVFPAPVGVVPTQQNTARRTFSKVTWRAGIDYNIGNTLLYATVSTGYKAGGFNDGCEAGTGTGCVLPADILYYDPETLTAYEGGVKTRFADGAVRLNASIFHYDYKGLQLSFQSNSCGGPCQITTNAAAAKVDGIELETVLQPHSAHRFDFSISYLNARYKRFRPHATIDYAGVDLDRSPSLTASAGYNFTYEMANGGKIEAGARVRLSDAYYITDFAVPLATNPAQKGPLQFRQPSFHKTDLTLTYTAPEDRFYLQAYAKNLENEITLSTASAQNGTSAAFADPRTYGVRAGVKF